MGRNCKMKYLCVDCDAEFLDPKAALNHHDELGHFVSGEVTVAQPIEENLTENKEK